jgi:hypothetical protein
LKNNCTFLVALEFKLRVSCLVGRHSTTSATSPAQFCFSYCVFCLKLALDFDSPTYAYQVAGVTGTHHFSQLVLLTFFSG